MEGYFVTTKINYVSCLQLAFASIFPIKRRAGGHLQTVPWKAGHQSQCELEARALRSKASKQSSMWPICHRPWQLRRSQNNNNNNYNNNKTALRPLFPFSSNPKYVWKSPYSHSLTPPKMLAFDEPLQQKHQSLSGSRRYSCSAAHTGWMKTETTDPSQWPGPRFTFQCPKRNFLWFCSPFRTPLDCCCCTKVSRLLC